ncbi:unnamed protein product [Ectocarpus sp. 12 AP-2014]
MKSRTHELQSTATSTNVVASKSRAQQQNSASAGPSSSSKTTSSTAPGGWLALSVASGNVGGLSDDGESDLVGNGSNNSGDTGKEDTATQTDDVVIVEANKTVLEQTTSKNPTKSKLPPWAKPWSKPAAPAVADPDSMSPSSVDNRQAPDVDEDKAINTGGASSGGGGGLDWISAAVDNGTSNLSHGPSASTTDTGGVPARATRGSSDQEKGGERGSLSWLAKAAAGSSDRPADTAGKSTTSIVATQGTATTDDDWLATAASRAARAYPSPSGRPSTETTAAGRRGSGGGWMAAAAGTQGLPLLDGHDGDGSVSDGVDTALLKKKGREQGNASAAQSVGAGGWMAKAILSGYLADTALSEDNADDEVASRAEPARQGKTIATQTDEVVRQAAAEPAKPKLPPWAKPWSAPAPATVSDPVSTPATGVDSVVGEGTGLNRRASYESSTSDTKEGRTTAGGGDGGIGGIDWVTQVTSEGPETTAQPDHDYTAVNGLDDLLAAALSGNSKLVTEAATATTASGPDRGVSKHNVRSNNSSCTCGSATKHSVKTTPASTAGHSGRPGGWLIAAVAPSGPASLIENDTEEDTYGNNSDIQGGGAGRVGVETATIGVQWEEEAGKTVLPASSTKSRLPPWAKPYVRPSTEVTGSDDGSEGNDSARVVMESNGIQCGESMLGGRLSEEPI